MDDDLWGPPFAPVEQDDICYLHTLRGCDFYFDYRLDVIEENALNERSCMQALRILIKKEDAEIDELERVLVLLQNELAWAEHDDWPDICCNVVKQKTELLHEYLRTLKKYDAEGSEIQSLLHKEPAERLHSMLKALLESYCQAKDKVEKVHDAIPLDSRLGSTQSAIDEDATTSNISDAETVEIRDPCYGTEDGDLDTTLKLQETAANDSETVQPTEEHITELLTISAAIESMIKSEEVREHSCLPIAINKVSEPRKQADPKELLKPGTFLTEDSATNINRDDVRPLKEIQKLRKSDSSSLIKPGESQCSAADTSKSSYTLGQDKYGSCDPRGLVSNARQKLREKTCAFTEKMDSSRLITREDEERRKDQLQTVSFQDILSATEPFTIEHLLEMCDEQDKGREAKHDKENNVLQAAASDASAITAGNDELIPNLLLEPQSNPELKSTGIQKPVSDTTKKRLQNCGCNNMGLSKSFNRNVEQKVNPDKQGDAGEIAAKPGDSQRPTKKTKKNSSPADSNHGGIKSETESDKQTLSNSETLSTSELKEMRTNDLRAIAKALKVTHYYKLKKNDLVEQLTNRLIVQSGSYSPVSCLPLEYGKSPPELKLQSSSAPQDSTV